MHTLATEHWGQVRIQSFGSLAKGEGDGVAVLIGQPESEPRPLVRIHSRCLYGEVFRSLDCDCLTQYKKALDMIAHEGHGIVIYLDQEGRGCGLQKKAAAYEIVQAAKVDTVEAYRQLNLPSDMRHYSHVVAILREFGVSRIRLLTNNPRKMAELLDSGLEVQRVPLQVPPNEWNIAYLTAKQVKLGHDLGLVLGDLGGPK